jgi:hypothetical protein
MDGARVPVWTDPRKIWSVEDDDQGHDHMDHSAMSGMKINQGLCAGDSCLVLTDFIGIGIAMVDSAMRIR